MLTHPQKHVETKVIRGNEAFGEAMIKEPPAAWTKPQLWLYAFSIVGFFCSTMNGYVCPPNSTPSSLF